MNKLDAISETNIQLCAHFIVRNVLFFVSVSGVYYAVCKSV